MARSKEEDHLCDVGSFTIFGRKLWRSGNILWGLGNELWLANRCPPRKGHCRPPEDVELAYWGKVEAFLTLAGTQQRGRTAWLHGKLR